MQSEERKTGNGIGKSQVILLIALFKALLMNCPDKIYIHRLGVTGVSAGFNYSLYCAKLKIYTILTLLCQSGTCQ